MGGDVRTAVGVPKLSAFANGSGTPLVIDVATALGYFTDKNEVVPLATPAFEQSLTGNGYVKLPGGLIIQWGVVLADPAGTIVTLPIALSNGLLSVTATVESGTNPSTFVAVNLKTNTNFVVGTSTSAFVNWIAVGH